MPKYKKKCWISKYLQEIMFHSRKHVYKDHNLWSTFVVYDQNWPWNTKNFEICDLWTISHRFRNFLYFKASFDRRLRMSRSPKVKKVTQGSRKNAEGWIFVISVLMDLLISPAICFLPPISFLRIMLHSWPLSTLEPTIESGSPTEPPRNKHLIIGSNKIHFSEIDL